MQSNFQDVGDFHVKFNLPAVEGYWLAKPTGLENDEALMAFRTKFLDEELDEFKKGRDEGDVAQMADALIDLVYVALGTAHFLGLPWDSLWEDVQRANMTKVRAAADGSDSKRGSAFDVVKPPGWQGPNTNSILRDYGFEVPNE